LAANAEAIAEARKVGHRNSLALPLFFGGVLRQILGDRDGVDAHAVELAEIAGEAGFRFWSAGSTILRAWLFAEAGSVQKGRLELQRGLDGWKATGARFMIPYFLTLQATMEAKAGELREALTLLESAEAVIERTKERWFAAEVLRLQGEMLLRLGDDRAALASARFADAVATARAQGARFWELRAVLGLVTDQRSDNGAREELAGLYSSFTEGLALPELRAAQMLTMVAGAA
jgi:predicted ATPase